MAIVDIAGKLLWVKSTDLTAGTFTRWPSAVGDGFDVLFASSAGTCVSAATPAGTNAVAFPGTSVAALGLWAAASSSYDNDVYRADNVANSTASSRWASAAAPSSGAPEWIRVRPKTLTTATSIAVTPPNNAEYIDAPGDFTIRGSNDASTWTTLDTRTGVTWTLGVEQTFSFTNTTAYAYYEILCTRSASTTGSVRVAMFKVNGSLPSTFNYDGEMWMVVKSATTGRNSWTLGTVGTTCYYPYTDGLVYEGAMVSTRQSFTPTVSISSTYRIYRVRVDSSGVWTAYLDGTSQSTSSGRTKAWSTAPKIGAATAGFDGRIAEIVVFGAALSSTDATTVYNELVARHITVASGATAAVGATLPSLSSAVVGVSTIAATVAVALPSMVGASAATSTVTAAAAATLPSLVSASAATSTITVAAAATLPSLSATVLATSDDTTFSAIGATLPSLTGAAAATSTASVTVGASLPSMVAAVDATVTAGGPTTTLLDFRIPRRFDWVENGTQVDTPEVTVLRFASRRGFTMRGLLTPVAPPLGVLTEWPIQRQAHLMPALTAATPRFRVGNPANPGEYAVDYGDTGRLHVFVGGVDVTYLRGVPAGFDDYSSAVPVNATSATVKLPQLKPWDQPGTGDLSMLSKDAPVEVVMVRPDDSLDYKWEGFFQVDEENSGTGEDYTFRAQGLFYQAAHEPWDPPVVLEPTDIGWLVADAMNGVTHRRWAKIPRVDTGIMSRNRGSQGQSVWQYVQDLLSQAWTDDGRQWTLARVAPYTYRIQVKAAMTDVRWTVTKGAPGVEVNLSEDQSTRRDAIYGRGFAPDGGYWCGRVFPGLEFGVPPRYPMNNTSLTLDGRSDSTTDTGNGVSTWQRQMRELGYPVTVDGVMNPADVTWVRKIQRDRGLTVDGSLGPQTWAATWENNSTDADLTSYRLPLATLPTVEPFLYSGSGAKVGTNPADDKSIIRHAMPEVDFGSGVKKSEAIELARKMLAREQTPGVSGTVSLLTDPHESGSSRFDIQPGDNVKVRGHRGADVVLQVAEVSVQGLSVNLTVDSRARDALTVLAILERNRDALRDPSGRNGTTDGSSLNKASVVQYESESKAGTIPRTAVNGDTGLWTIRKTFVSQVGVAKIAFTATSPKAELCVALFNRPIVTSVLAAMVADPLADSNGWYDNEQKLREKYGLMEIFGGPGNPGGYFPRQKGKGPLTGRLEDTGSTLYDSPYGGFVWVAMFTSRSTWVEGRVFPAVPT